MLKFMTVLSAIVLSASLSQARPGGKHHGPGMWGPKEFKELNLTAEQRDKVKAIREASKDKAKALRQETKEANKKLKEILATEASKDDLNKAFENVQTKRAEMGKFMFGQMLQIRDILTPEQRAKVKDLRDGHRGDDDDGE